MAKTRKTREVRKSKIRPTNKVILIVCEGEVTEPLYFKSLKSSMHNKSVSVRIPDPKVTDPVSLVKYAKKYIDNEGLEINQEHGDRVYCVFDLDQHDNSKLQEAFTLARQYGFTLILSNPCFEEWYLLHFRYSTAYLTTSSAGQELKKYIPDYEKNKPVYGRLLPLQPTAIANAERLNQEHDKNGIALFSKESNPSTQVFEIVKYVTSL